MLFVRIAPSAHLPAAKDELTYTVPAELLPQLKLGQLVQVRVHGRKTWGIVTALSRRAPTGIKQLLPIDNVMAVNVPPHIVKLGQAIRANTGQPLGLCLGSLLPPKMKRLPVLNAPSSSVAVKTRASQTISLTGDIFKRFKEYLHLAEKSLRSGQSTIIVFGHRAHLEAFIDFCPIPLLRWNADASSAQRWRMWSLAQTKPQLLVGLRSSVTAPAFNLGLLVIDEPSQRGHKDDQSPYLTSSQIARLRQSIDGCHIVFGSTLPPLVTRHTQTARILTSHRANITLLASDPTKGSVLQSATETWLAAQINSKKRGIILVNRVGSGIERCRTCHTPVTCPSCNRNVIRQNQSLVCLVCRWHGPQLRQCPICHGQVFTERGTGTEAITQRLAKLFDQSVTIVDRYHPDWPTSDARLIVGTSFLVPYLVTNRPDWSLVLGIDAARRFPSYTAGEQALRLIVELVALTFENVALETVDPTNAWFKSIQANSLDTILAAELTDRQQFGYPPVTTLVALLAQSPVPLLVMKQALTDHGIQSLGPTTQVTSGKVRLIVKLPSVMTPSRLIKWLSPLPGFKDVTVELDPPTSSLD